jgi:hypothetical protein
MKAFRRHTSVPASAREGSALVMVLSTVFASSLLALALMTVVSSSTRELRGSRADTAAHYACEAGLAAAVFDLQIGGTGALGSEDVPIAFGRARYWVQMTDLGDGRTSLVATGTENGSGARIEAVVRQAAESWWQWGAFGDESLHMDSNAFVDSYDSQVGTYASQVVNGSGGDAWAGGEGNVGSNGNVTLTSNATVHGDAHPGPGGTTTVTGNAEVTGSTTPLPQANEMPPIVVPDIPTAGPLTVGGGNTHELASGSYHFDAVRIDGSAALVIEGPATLVFESMELRSNSSLRVDAEGGPVEIYVINDFVMNSNTLVAAYSNLPRDLSFHLLSDNVINPELEVDLDEVDFDSNAKLYGTIYGPSAAIEINSNFELFGAIVARSLDLDSNSRIHYDESLAEIAAEEEEAATMEIVCWRTLPWSGGNP